MSTPWYVVQEDARGLLAQRLRLRAAVEECWKAQGFVFPSAFLGNQFVGFVSRHLATARYEDCAFILLAEQAGLAPVWSTYVRDRFVTHSPVKASYVLPRIVTGFSPRGFPEIQKVRLADARKIEERRLSLNEIFVDDDHEDVPLMLTEWHHALLYAAYSEAIISDLRTYTGRGAAPRSTIRCFCRLPWHMACSLRTFMAARRAQD